MLSRVSLTITITILIVASSKSLVDNSDKSWSKHLMKKILTASKLPLKTISVSCPDDDIVLKSCVEALKLNLAKCILVGNEAEIRKVAKENNIDISSFRVINEPEPNLAGLTAVKLVHDGEADIYMKGLIPTKEFLRSLLDKKVGLRTGQQLTHVVIAEIEGIEQLLFLTDGGVIMYPNLEDKVHLINNAVEIAKAFDVFNPKVAALAAIEVVNPRMQATVDAEKLTLMNEQGAIKDCIVDGPISLDMALSKEACIQKRANRKIMGDADILVFPNIESNNMSWKFITLSARHIAGMLLVGTSHPVVLTSRSDDVDTKVHSIACAVIYDEYMKKHKKY